MKYNVKTKSYTDVGTTYVPLFTGDDIETANSKICKVIGIHASGFTTTAGSIAIGSTAANAVAIFASASGIVDQNGKSIIIRGGKGTDGAVALWVKSTTSTDDPTVFISYEVE